MVSISKERFIASTLWKRGVREVDICRATGMSVRRFRRMRMKEPDVFPRRDQPRYKTPDETISRLVDMWNGGATIAECATALGITHSQVNNWIRRARKRGWDVKWHQRGPIPQGRVDA